MNGYIITYKPLDINSKVNFHHILFGRLLTRIYKGEKRIVYVKGILHDFQFKRLENSKIYVTTIENINIEELKIFARINIEETNDIYDDLKTGEQYWKDVASKKGKEIYYGKRQKYNESSATGSPIKNSTSIEGTRIFTE